MKADDLFRKTARGQEEIETRSNGLSVQQRRVLILVNGSNSLAELERISLCENTAEVLETLIAQGLIESGAKTSASTTVAAQDYARD